MNSEAGNNIDNFFQHASRGWPVVSTAELARLYFEERLTVKEIGNRIGVHPSTVRLRLVKAGYTMRTRKEASSPSQEIVSTIMEMYFIERLSCSEIATKMGFGYTEKVARIIRDNGRELRDNVAARRIRAWNMPSIERRLTYGGAARMLNYSKTKERNAKLRKRIPPGEAALLAMLEERGVPDLVQQRSVSIYNMDFASGPVGIEIVGGRRKCAYFASSAERIYFILKSGFHLIEVMYGEPIDPLKNFAGDEIVAFIERTKLLPPSVREYRMIGGSGQLLAVFKVDLDDLT